ncbi:hypothetical protein Pla110_01410 [Polystyrenella longa]|uniref:Uncharacterized protein n=1 Tax=Polystyrenella longa TaxID=2528007 RepID=A0A518CGU3_9PLAN|nr:hypothetical protein [Polystyrenella longa]QDU78440.1 hypothetical protein Pla110_01410 [Polystyrenella longa]
MNLSEEQTRIVYDALIFAVRNNSKIGFQNGDQGHPAYMPVGNTDEEANNHEELGDSPQNNALYNLLHALNKVLGDSADPRINSWEDFCTLANSHRHR